MNKNEVVLSKNKSEINVTSSEIKFNYYYIVLLVVLLAEIVFFIWFTQYFS